MPAVDVLVDMLGVELIACDTSAFDVSETVG